MLNFLTLVGGDQKGKERSQDDCKNIDDSPGIGTN
jgi:hypothetical protein